MELVELLRLVIEKVEPLRQGPGGYGQDPNGLLYQLVAVAEQVVDDGLLIGRGW